MGVIRDSIIFPLWLHIVFGDCGIIPREEWKGLSCQKQDYLPRPVDLVIIEETSSQSCKVDEKCEEIMRNLQTLHMERNMWTDIGHSFVIGGNGRVYEGKGWLHAGSHTLGYNNISINIAFIGTFTDKKPKPAALNSLKSLLKCGMRKGHLAANYQIVVQKQLVDTENPGQKLFKKIKQLSHWEKDIQNLRVQGSI